MPFTSKVDVCPAREGVAAIHPFGTLSFDIDGAELRNDRHRPAVARQSEAARAS